MDFSQATCQSHRATTHVPSCTLHTPEFQMPITCCTSYERHDKSALCPGPRLLRL
ncbi:hypothetical protein M404DRAFT_1004907 [Pisolithus tinctorius Marx 270]|uniref:Uncharacterized protein n=1 Tax=Pisolithus tinctorius Marx 270 TaxID=870435 RepID=A0A0C3NV14_PISTI|nr:hypothetical protein M404DRAFT_1004907 [Pisolithus tinctorius Marx 270]